MKEKMNLIFTAATKPLNFQIHLELFLIVH